MVALSTIDNPYSPITQFQEWLQYDMDKGYNSCGFLDRIATTSNSFTDEENEEEIEKAIDNIVKYDPLNLYIKVKE